MYFTLLRLAMTPANKVNEALRNGTISLAEVVELLQVALKAHPEATVKINRDMLMVKPPQTGWTWVSPIYLDDFAKAMSK
jgi:hypothetical protein